MSLTSEEQFVVDLASGAATYRRGGNIASAVDFTFALRDAANYRSPVRTIVVSFAVAAFIALLMNAWLALAITVGGIALAVHANARAVVKRRVSITYWMDAAASRTFDAISNGCGWLTSSRAVWRIAHEERGPHTASPSSVRRFRAQCTKGDAANLRTNVSIPSISAAGESLLFMPDALLIRDEASGVVFDVPYASLRVDVETMRFSEPEFSPDDARQVDSSWLYANRNGSPDRRRAGNRQIPIFEYGRVALSWPRSGRVLLASNVQAARNFANGLLPAMPPRAPAGEATMTLQQTSGPTDLERALQASIDRKRRLQQLERLAATAPQTPVRSHAEWLAQGRSTVVHGISTGDLVYVGSQLPAFGGRGTEPSLIDPALPVDPAVANTGGGGIGYWPSYGALSPSSRRAYLLWLAGGRADPGAYIGYVFIFFYGLERRVYEFIQGRDSSADEGLAIAAEVARLLDVYGSKSSSFDSYGSALLDLIASIEPRARKLMRDGPRYDIGISRRLQITLGEHALAATPIPAQYALQWVRSSYSLNTPATRCAPEFELLFHVRYAKRFGEGLVIKPNKTFIDMHYRPASAALEPVAMTQRRIPDVTRLSRPLDKLIALAQECTGALDPFSRFLGKNSNGRESLAAFALLPEDLVEATLSSDANAIASLVRSRLDGGGRAHLAAGELLHFVRLANPSRVAKHEALLLAQALEKLGYGIEPDVRLGGPVFDPKGRIVVFRRLPDCPSTPSGEYTAATLLVRLGAMVSAADDAVSEAERDLLERHIEERLQLNAGERQRLGAHLAWLFDSDLGMSGLRRRLDGLPKEGRAAIGRLLIGIAATDGQIDGREMKILEKIYELLELPAGDLYRDVHAAQTQDDEPIPVGDAAPPAKGYPIPPQPRIATPGIDMNRVRLKIAETRQVSTLLSSIFADEEAPPPAAAPPAQTGSIGTLDAAHSELLRRLAARESWPRDEVERLAHELSLMTDGALETINDYAYAAADEPLWEDVDPVVINSKVAMELIA